MEQKDEDFDGWWGGEWCKVCALTIGMAKLGWCDWQKKLKAQGKECPKLLSGEKADGHLFKIKTQ
jgi:hypothetical protein